MGGGDWGGEGGRGENLCGISSVGRRTDRIDKKGKGSGKNKV